MILRWGVMSLCPVIGLVSGIVMGFRDVTGEGSSDGSRVGLVIGLVMGERNRFRNARNGG